MEYISRNTTPQGHHVIQVGFFQAESSCLTSFAQARYAHVELRFSDNAVTSITRDPGYVHYEQGRMLSNPKYRCFFEIALAPAEEARMQEIAREYAKDTTAQFSYLAMIWNFAPITRLWPLDGLFCSQYVTLLLQKVGLAADLLPARTSPDDLFDYLKHERRAIASYNRCLFKLKA